MCDITVSAAAGLLSNNKGISGFFRRKHLDPLCGFTIQWAHLYENVYTLQHFHAAIESYHLGGALELWDPPVKELCSSDHLA